MKGINVFEFFLEPLTVKKYYNQLTDEELLKKLRLYKFFLSILINITISSFYWHSRPADLSVAGFYDLLNLVFMAYSLLFVPVTYFLLYPAIELFIPLFRIYGDMKRYIMVFLLTHITMIILLYNSLKLFLISNDVFLGYISFAIFHMIVLFKSLK